MNSIIEEIGQSARKASSILAKASTQEKNNALLSMAASLRNQQSEILIANEKDRLLAQAKQMPPAFLDRLTLTPERILAMAAGLEMIAALDDPIGTILAETVRPNQLVIKRVRVPLGVIGVIYESRPNVTADAAGLCLKSGNAVILRGGSESFYSASTILQVLYQGLEKTNLPLSSIQMIPTSERSAIDEMVKMDQYIDVIIPRGGPKLIAYISEKSRIPLFKHLAGLCHTYIHEAANLEMARKIIINAKMRRTGICGATEVLLIDESIATAYLPIILDDLIQAGCEIRADEIIIKIDNRVKLADDQDFHTEFLNAIIAVKIVKNMEEAIKHIAKYGTQHTDAIITDDKKAAQQFLNEVDSAIVMHNTSTQFADGQEFGMGAEMGIATGKLHARGPVGINELTTFKYQVYGNGQVRA